MDTVETPLAGRADAAAAADSRGGAKGTFWGVGVGPGDPELLTLKAVRVLREADVLVAPQTSGGGTCALDIARRAVDLSDKRVLELRFEMSRDAAVLHASHERAAAAIAFELDAGHNVAMPNLGDVSIYSTFSYMKELLESAGYAVGMVSGVPSFCAVAARLDTTLTPSMTSPLTIVPSGYGELAEALALPGTKVIMKAGKSLPRLRDELRSAGVYERTSLVQDCGMPSEVVAESLDDAPERGGYFTTLVVRP